MIATRYWSFRRKMSVARRGRRIYGESFKASKIVFVHIPKCAGTSISHAVFGNDPWHYTAEEYARAEPEFWRAAFAFSFVRDPISRFESSFYYAAEDVQKYRGSSLAFVLRYRNINEFVQRVGAENLTRHPFFWPQVKYLFDVDGRISVDYVGRFENLREDFAAAMTLAGRDESLPHLNRSLTRISDRPCLDAKSSEIIRRVYREDYERLGYE